MIICITGNYRVYDEWGDTGKTEFVVSHGIDAGTNRQIVLPQEHPSVLGAKFDIELGEWVIK